MLGEGSGLVTGHVTHYLPRDLNRPYYPSLLRTVLGGLVIASIMGLAGCEELTPPKDKAPPTRMSRYRAADEEAIKARWEGMSAVGAGGSGTATASSSPR